MFSLLSPIALWLAPLIAVPLAIALMGRAEPKTRDFPSLLPVRESLRNAMRRHRLRNWLQLILRTLVVLCLLLAAAGPVWRGRGGDASSVLPLPSTIGFLFHNGAYAAIPLSPASGDMASSPSGEPQTFYDRFDALQQELDSLSRLNQGRMLTELVLPEPSGDAKEKTATPRGPARLGNLAVAVTRLLHTVDEASGKDASKHVFVPVFSARDLSMVAHITRPWLIANPQARLVVMDYGDVSARLNAFSSPRAETNSIEGMLSLRTRVESRDEIRWITASSNHDRTKSGPFGLPRDVGRDVVRKDDEAVLTLALPDAGGSTHWLAGSFTLALDEAGSNREVYAFPTRNVSYRVPPPAILCHMGSREAFTSRATLGEEGTRLKIKSLSTGPIQGGHRGDWSECDLLYLADPPEADASLFSRAAAVARSGGLVILETGRHTDTVLWNRALLSPLGTGLLTDRMSSTATMPAAAASGGRKYLETLGIRAQQWGKPGLVKTRFGFRPGPETKTLLTAGEGQSSLLAFHRVGRGGVLLWTTSLSDPEWSDIGLGPWAALLHQSLIERSWAAEVVAEEVDTDSTYWWPAPTVDHEAVPGVADPEGNPFTRVRAEPGGFAIGPFDRPGLYRIEAREAGNSKDQDQSKTSWLAVNVAEAPLSPSASDRADFWAAMGQSADKTQETDVRQQIRLIEPDDDWQTLYRGINLRGVLLLLAALLLFAEGVVTLRLANASRPEA